MKRLDFLKTLSVPFVLPFATKAKPPKYTPKPGDIAYFDGKDYNPISTAYSEGARSMSGYAMTGDFFPTKSIF